MAKRKFRQIINLTCYSLCIWLPWFSIILIFYIGPKMLFLAIKRGIIKRRMQRDLIRNGLPKPLAKQFAKNYQTEFLKRYGSLKGIFHIIKEQKKRTEPKSINFNENTQIELSL